MFPARLRLPAALLVLLAPALAACTENKPAASEEDRTIEVTSSDDACELSATEVPSGSLTFAVENTGSQVTEFYLYAADGERIVGEVENIGPGLSRDLTVAAPAGSYVAACKPGMAGDGIRVDVTVTESGEAVAPVAEAALLEKAEDGYEEFVHEEAAALVARTQDFVAAYVAGDDAQARALYPQARTHWERIETVAESFADLDPILDAREADLAPGERWTGWHRLEKDLWPARAEDYVALTAPQRQQFADHLMENTRALQARIDELTFTIDQIANGARGLLEEVATGKITGEEEYWSRTDLWDFQANIDGAKEAFELLEAIVATHDPELEKTLDDRFDEVQTLLDRHREGDGFRSYDELSQSEVKELADAVNALAEPLSDLTAVVVS